jgi:general secretion pathway protein D
VQWLAQNTGKTVIKHPRAMCQVTITSSKKMPKRQAIGMVYRALALEGFTATESSTAILITPEGQEPKLSPEFLAVDTREIPEGHQRLMKVFPVTHMQPAELREKVRGVLSDKGTVEADERARQLIVTDYTDNLRLIGELIEAFDVSDSDLVMRIYQLKHADAEEVGNLIGAILNAQPVPPGSSAAPRPSPGSSSSGPMNMPPGMISGMPSGTSSSSPSPPGGIGAQISTPQARLWPDRSANRLIVSASKSKQAEVQRLVDILDTDKPEDVAMRVLPLRHVSATDLMRELSPIYQRRGGGSRKESVEIGANERSNSLLILSSLANFKEIENIVTDLDSEDAQEKAVRTFTLKNADAQDVAKQLQELTRKQDSSRNPYYYIFSSSSSDDGSKKQMSVVADRRRNAIVVQAPPAEIEGIASIVEELDQPVTDDSLAPRIYHLKYVSAADIEDVLNELFLKRQQQRSYFYYYDDYQEPAADRDVGRLYGKVRITSEPHSNSLIVTSNSKENLAAVEEVLKQLDQPSEAGESTLRVNLQFAKAINLANSLNILFAKNGSPPLRQVAQPGQPQAQQNFPQPQQQASGTAQAGFELEKKASEDPYYPWLGGQPDNPRSTDGRAATRPVSDLVGRVRVVADSRSNSLLISANVHFFPQLLKLVNELDARTDQVLIEAKIVEVATDYMDRLGVRWSPDGSSVFTAEDLDNSIIVSSQGSYQQGFGGTTRVNSPPVPGTDLAQTLTQLRSGVLSSTVNLDFLIQFLKKRTNARVLAEPQVNIRDNETGRLFVGQQVPIPDNNQVSGLGTTTTSFTYKDVGVVLAVTPHINSAGDVELAIHAESSTVVPGATVLGGSVFDTRNFRTDLTAKNGETLVLGGIIQTLVSDTLRKTPILGDIPGLGWAFKKRDKTSREVEMMVFLRPKVTRSEEDNHKLLDHIFEKAPLIKQWKDGIEPGKPGKPVKPATQPAAPN